MNKIISKDLVSQKIDTYGLPQSEVEKAVARGYTIEALQDVQQFLVRAFFEGVLVHNYGDTLNAGILLKETANLWGREALWAVQAFDAVADDGGVRLLETIDGITRVVFELSHWEFTWIWLNSLS